MKLYQTRPGTGAGLRSQSQTFRESSATITPRRDNKQFNDLLRSICSYGCKGEIRTPDLQFMRLSSLPTALLCNIVERKGVANTHRHKAPLCCRITCLIDSHRLLFYLASIFTTHFRKKHLFILYCKPQLHFVRARRPSSRSRTALHDLLPLHQRGI